MAAFGTRRPVRGHRLISAEVRRAALLSGKLVLFCATATERERCSPGISHAIGAVVGRQGREDMSRHGRLRPRWQVTRRLLLRRQRLVQRGRLRRVSAIPHANLCVIWFAHLGSRHHILVTSARDDAQRLDLVPRLLPPPTHALLLWVLRLPALECQLFGCARRARCEIPPPLRNQRLLLLLDADGVSDLSVGVSANTSRQCARDHVGQKKSMNASIDQTT
jgi:hypothetical protein